jgi:hypothetical protein
LVLKIEGADVDMFPEPKVHAAAKRINLIGVRGVELCLKPAEAALEFEVGVVPLAKTKNVAGAEEIGVFPWSGEAELMDVARNPEVIGEVKASVNGEARDDGSRGATVGNSLSDDRGAVGTCHGKAPSELSNAKTTRGGGFGLGVRPIGLANDARKPDSKRKMLQGRVPPERKTSYN